MRLALDVASIISEVQTASGAAGQLSARNVYDYLGLVLAKYGIASNGIATYTVNGRTVTRSVKELLDVREHFRSEMNREEYGGIGEQTIAFRPAV